jgi:hypothetical protein
MLAKKTFQFLKLKGLFFLQLILKKFRIHSLQIFLLQYLLDRFLLLPDKLYLINFIYSIAS